YRPSFDAWRNVRADLPRLSTAMPRPRRSGAGKVRHHLAREQLHRRLGLGATDHAEIHLQRRALEAADAAVITLDCGSDLLGRTDPCQASDDLRFKRLAPQALDHFLVLRIDARGHP